MKFPFLFFGFLYALSLSCQGGLAFSENIPKHTANSHVDAYGGYFLYGSNMGWLNENWRDEDIADILIGNETQGIEGVGVRSLRPALYEDFVERWGYDIKVNTFKYYAEQGAKHHVVFIGDRPSEQHREKKQHVPGVPSSSYENLYEPVWIENESGTSINENNVYALYVYKLVQNYKNHVQFWEIKNEPDLTDSPCGWAHAGTECNWWDRNPSPAELIHFHAPIQSYIRMLRISYEVIKSVDPKAYICIGGIGYESFLDAVLRNTDNPDHGKVAERYPLKGGAWFDCLSFHIYPMYYLSSWGNNGWNYFRHSDAAVAAVENQTNTYVELLKKYGYGMEYPTKEMIISETNIPNKQIGTSIGSEEAQRNYLMKLAISAQKQHLRGVYPFSVWDNSEQNAYGDEYAFMGFYKPLPELPRGPLRINEAGIGWRTTSKWLGQRKYDENETQRLALPSNIEGGAFYSEDSDDYVYVLWAKTTADLSEEASASYRFPASMNVKEITSTHWTENQTLVAGNSLHLSGTPLFIQIK
ncbi:MAG: hypothetical protein FWG75_00295 [Cystobacterineae bacterium]|nr:hypothetical protein [Cystobacterineae bacterium]